MAERHEAAAVDHQGLAGHVAGEVAGEEDGDGADVGFGVADAAQRRAADEQAVGEHGAGLGDHLHRRGHGDGPDAVHPHAGGPPLPGQALGQAALGGLGDGVRREVGAALDSRGRGDQDEGTAPGLELRVGGVRAEVRRPDRGAEHGLPRGVGDGVDGEGLADGSERVVDHDVEPAELGRPRARPRRRRRRGRSRRSGSSGRAPPRASISAATTSPVSVRRAAITTLAPWVAHASAIPRPTPPPAPVTTTVRPSSSAVVVTVPSRCRRRRRACWR